MVRLTVTYDRRYQPPTSADGEQLLLGHTRGLLLPRREADDAPGRWWCGKGRLLGDLIAEHGRALAVNPQERLVATVADAHLAREAGLIRVPPSELLLCVVDELEHARLDADGLHTPAGDALDKALKRRRAAEADRERHMAEAEARDREPQRAAEAERRRVATATYPRLATPSVALRPERDPFRAIADDEPDWPRDLGTLWRLLADDELARRVEQPLSTDVECDVPVAIWHLMAVLEARRRGGNPHPMAVRAGIVARCGYTLTREAIAGVLAVAQEPAG